MGRLTGALLSTILVASTTYLTTVHLRTYTTTISHNLTTSRHVLDSLHHPATPVRPLREYLARPSMVETMKDAWNSELEKAVRAVHTWDVRRGRERVEELVGGLLAEKK
ncbi:hypothetical protein DFH27DRAFT_222670 [Peziza echinospora]|nr:hypothetical protein DFH27DRAFT_222670 [Peziza echinospora]